MRNLTVTCLLVIALIAAACTNVDVRSGGPEVRFLSPVADEAYITVDFVDNARQAEWSDEQFPPELLLVVAQSWFGQVEDLDADTTLGFTFDQVDLMMTNIADEFVLEVQGDLDPDAVKKMAQADPDWGGQLTEATSSGLAYLDWGAPFGSGDRSFGRSFGEGGSLYVEDGAALRGRNPDSLETPLSRYDPDDDLVELDDTNTMLGELRGRQFLTAVISAPVPATGEAVAGSFGSAEAVVRLDAELEGRGLGPFTLVAAGTLDDGDGPLAAAVIAHASGDDAQANAERLQDELESGRSLRREEPWSAIIDDYEITVDGSILLVTFTRDGDRIGSFAAEMLITSDALFLQAA